MRFHSVFVFLLFCKSVNAQESQESLKERLHLLHDRNSEKILMDGQKEFLVDNDSISVWIWTYREIVQLTTLDSSGYYTSFSKARGIPTAVEFVNEGKYDRFALNYSPVLKYKIQKSQVILEPASQKHISLVNQIVKQAEHFLE